MSNSKVKGLLKGLRYISQIFDNEKEAEMQIGHPTDVKHVAHIGWEGPVNSPSWMNEFKRPASFSSAPLCLPAPGDSCMSEDRSRRGGKDSNSAAGSQPDAPKPSRRPSSIESPSTRERSERPKARRSSKSKTSDKKQTTDHNDDSPATALCLPDIPRTGRRKKTSRSKPQVADTYKAPFSDPGFVSATGSTISISKDSGLCLTP